MIWQTSRFRIALTRPQVMGIVNVTPDSFSDGGRFAQADAARAHCDLLVAQGADILDIGGESTRPGALLPDTAEQLARVRIALDPGIGFGKTPAHNLALAANQRRLLELGCPLLLGWSRKSTLGQ